MTILNTTTASNGSTQLSVERQLAELIDEVRASVGSQATLAAKTSFNPKETLTKFNHLIEKAINNIKDERDQAITSQSSQAIIDNLNQQLELVEERATTFQDYLSGLATSSPLARTSSSEQSNALSAWLDEVSPLAEPEDFTEMPFQSLKADRTNVPRDFSIESTSDINIKTRALKNIDDFFLPEYVASANETEITEDILAKAKELGNSPVKIYEWVRNNVEWQPTWGGQQTADMTLDVRRGNAMDISTLMIALLRAAKIPSRYVHGTVDIPVDNFINMAGDFENVDAAMDFVSAGGIPVTSVSVGGKIAKVRIEHVWVEAAVPYYPSRGSKPPSARNPIDSWIPLDGSYKQYEYLQGINSEIISSINGEQLAKDFSNSGLINEQGGWLQGQDANIIEQARIQIQNDLRDYIKAMQNPSIGDVIGGRIVVKQKFNMLPGSLPHSSIVRGVSYAQLITNLQVQITLGLGYDRYIDEYQQQQTWPLYELNQRDLSISFKPASLEDENTLNALIPNNTADPNQLPRFFPSSIHVVPEVKLEEKVILTSNVLVLGDNIRIGYKINYPQRVYFNKYYDVIAGSYLAIGVVGSNISVSKLNKLKINFEKVKTILESKNETQIKNLSRESTLGYLFTLGIISYYAQYINQSKILAQQLKVRHITMPSIGTFGYESYKQTLFGLNRGIEEHGMYMNTYIVNVILENNGDIDKTREFTISAGVLGSALEHTIPEQLFTDSNNLENKPNGFSATKALGMALEQGQRIYTITPSNQSIVLVNLHLDEYAMNEIKSALLVGKHIITHAEQLTVPGFKGSGYIILDPITGAASYKISGGKNGGWLLGVLNGFGLAALIGGWVFAAPFALMIVLAILLVASVIASLIAIMIAEDPAGSANCYIGGIRDGMFGYAMLLAYLKGYTDLPTGTADNKKAFWVALFSAIYAKLSPPGYGVTECVFG